MAEAETGVQRIIAGTTSAWRNLAQNYLWPRYYAAVARGDRYKARTRDLEAEIQRLRDAEDREKTVDVAKAQLALDEVLAAPATEPFDDVPAASRPVLTSNLPPIIPGAVVYRETLHPTGVIRRWEFPFSWGMSKYIVEIMFFEDENGVRQNNLRVAVTPVNNQDAGGSALAAYKAVKQVFELPENNLGSVPFGITDDNTLFAIEGGWEVWYNSRPLKTLRQQAE